MNNTNYQVGKKGAHVNGRLTGEIMEVKKDTLLVKWFGDWLQGTRTSEVSKNKFRQW